MVPFTKTELLNEFREIIYQFARSTSFVLSPETGYRILFGEPNDEHEIYRFMNPNVNSADIGLPFSIDMFQATRSVEEYYDYGLLGIRKFDPNNVTDATEWTFAYGLIRDCADSFLISESLNGEHVSTNKCMTAAQAFFARMVLDGHDRVFLSGGEDAPDGMLTISEISVLSGLDERTVRNATLKSAANRLETALVQSAVYVPREAALAWLSTKRGFTATNVGETATNEAILNSPFPSASEAGTFVHRLREKSKLSINKQIHQSGTDVDQADIEALERGEHSPKLTERALSLIGHTLGLNGGLFALRVMEVWKREEMTGIQQKINTAMDSPQEWKPVFELGLTHRTGNCLKSAGIEVLSDIASRTRQEISKIGGLGRKGVEEVESVLAKHGLSFASTSSSRT